jgi:hypothetical protein
VIACPLRPEHAKLAYDTVYLTGLGYSLPTTSLDEKQCAIITQKVRGPILRKMGFPESFPNGVVYGDEYFGGCGLRTTENEQGIAKILLLIRNIRGNTPLGEQILINLRYYQLHAGIETNILENLEDLTYIKGAPWITNLRKYMRKISATITLTKAWTNAVPQREKDVSIMQKILSAKAFTEKELDRIHACRMYLQITMISEMATADGTYLLHDFLHGKYTKEELNERRETGLQWPNQDRPDKTAWKIWTLALQKTICTQSGKLKETLGKWNHDNNKVWNSVLSSETGKLYTRQPNNTWKQHEIAKRGLITQFEISGKAAPLPRDAYPILPKIGKNTLICHKSKSTTQLPPIERETSSTFKEYLRNKTEPWEQPLLADIREMTNGVLLLYTLLAIGTRLFFVTDGGDTDGDGYFGWVLATDTEILWTGSGLSPGNKSLNESLRSESTAYLSILRFLLHYHRFYQITLQMSPKIHFCDNKSLVSREGHVYQTAPMNSFKTLKADYDIQMKIM